MRSALSRKLHRLYGDRSRLLDRQLDRRAFLRTSLADRFEELFPGYREHRTRDAAFVRWPEDPWTRTGYSCPAPGTGTTVSPLTHRGLGRLHFAGEHASPGFFGPSDL